MNRVAQHPVQAFACCARCGRRPLDHGHGDEGARPGDRDLLCQRMAFAAEPRSLPGTLSSATAAVADPVRAPDPRRPRLVVTVMAGLFFWGIGRVPLAQAIALTFIAPLIALLLAASS